MLNVVKFALEQIIGSLHQAKPLFGCRHVDDLPGEVGAMTLKMGEDDVDGLTQILGRPPLRTFLYQILGEAVDPKNGS